MAWHLWGGNLKEMGAFYRHPSLAHIRRRVVYIRPKQGFLQKMLFRAPDAGTFPAPGLDWLLAEQVLFLGPRA